MKYIVVHENGKVVDTHKMNDSANVAIVDYIPAYEPKEGYNGVLSYNDVDGLHWTYEEAPAPEPTTEERLEAMQAAIDMLCMEDAEV